MRELTSFYQKASVGRLREKDPLLKWAVESDDPNAYLAFGLRKLEDELIRIIEEYAPEFRDAEIAKLSANTGLPPEALQSMIDYYSIEIYEEPKLSGKSQEVWKRLENLRRAIRLTEPEKNSIESRYLSYLHWVTQESVPQMAKRFGVTETELRKQLSDLRISIIAEFTENEKLQQAKRLVSENKSIPEIANQLHVGENALTFILHYEHELNRGVPWNTIPKNSPFGKKTEADILEILKKSNFTYAEIAARLNSLFKRKVTDPDFRTEGAVAAKADRAGITKPQERFPADRKLPEPYGLVKRNGHLTEKAKEYIRDHRLDPLDEIAGQLFVKTPALINFIRRHDLSVKDMVEKETAADLTPGSLAESHTPLRAEPMSRIARASRARTEAVLAGHERQRKLRPKNAMELSSLRPSVKLNDYSLDDIERIFDEIVNVSFDGKVSAFRMTKTFESQQFSAPGSQEIIVGQTLLGAYARKLYERDHPGSSATSRIFTVPGYGRAEVVARFRKERGVEVVRPSNTVELPSLVPGRPLMSYSLLELDQLVQEMTLKTNQEGLKEFRLLVQQPYSAPGSQETYTGGSLLTAYARKLHEKDHPDLPVPTVTTIFTTPGYSKVEITKRFKKEHGVVELRPGDTLELQSIKPSSTVVDYSLSDIEAVMDEAVRSVFDGDIERLRIVPAFMNQTFGSPSGEDSIAGSTILRSYARRCFEKDHPDLPIPSSNKIHYIQGYSLSEVAARFKKERGIQLKPADAVELQTLKPKTRPLDHSLSELDAILLEAVKREFNGDINTFVMNTAFRDKAFSAPGSDQFYTGQTLFNSYVRKLYQKEHPGPLPGYHEVYTKEGYRHTDLVRRFISEHGGKKPKLPEDAIELTQVRPGVPLGSYSLQELDSLLVEAVAKGFDNDPSKITYRGFDRHFYAPGSEKSQTLEALLRHYARANYVEEHPKAPVPSFPELDKISGYGRREMIQRFKRAHGLVDKLPEGTSELKSLKEDVPLTHYTLEELDTVLLEAVNGDASKLSGSPAFLSRIFSAPGTHRTVVGNSILLAYSQKLFAKKYPTLPIPHRREVNKELGFSQAEVIEFFKQSHGKGTTRPDGAIELEGLKGDIDKLTTSELNSIFLEITKVLFENDVRKFSSSVMGRRFSPPGSQKSYTGYILLRAYGNAAFREDHPELKEIPSGFEIAKQEGFSNSDLFARFRKNNGAPLKRPSHSIELKAMNKGANFAKYSLDDLKGLVMEAVRALSEGEKKYPVSKFYAQPYSSSGSEESITGGALLYLYAMKLYETGHPGERVPTSDKIHFVPGYGKRELLDTFITNLAQP